MKVIIISGMTFLFMFLVGCTLVRQADIYLTSQQTSLLPVSTLDKNASSINAWFYDKAETPKSALLFVAGSGCASLHSYLPGYLSAFEGSFRVFAIEKPGIQQGDLGFECNETFQANNDFDSRLKRNSELLKWLISSGDNYENLILVGVSEGGPIASALVKQFDKDIDAGMVIGAGGLPQRKSLEILNQKYGAGYDLAYLDQKIAQNPNSIEIIYGQTVKYWASFLEISINDLLNNTTTPLMFVMGEHDQSEPIESLHALTENNYSNVVTLTVPDANHILVSNGIDQKPRYFQTFLEWLNQAQN